MIGKFLQRTRTEGWAGLMALSSKKDYDLMAPTHNVSAAGLPKAPENPYKKRPLKLVYDKNEYHAFRLPSENNFLLSSFDNEDLFG